MTTGESTESLVSAKFHRMGAEGSVGLCRIVIEAGTVKKKNRCGCCTSIGNRVCECAVQCNASSIIISPRVYLAARGYAARYATAPWHNSAAETVRNFMGTGGGGGDGVCIQRVQKRRISSAFSRNYGKYSLGTNMKSKKKNRKKKENAENVMASNH